MFVPEIFMISLIMREFLVETESGLIQESGLIHYEDAIEVAQHMAQEYQTSVRVLVTNPIIAPSYNLVETVEYCAA